MIRSSVFRGCVEGQAASKHPRLRVGTVPVPPSTGPELNLLRGSSLRFKDKTVNGPAVPPAPVRAALGLR